MAAERVSGLFDSFAVFGVVDGLGAGVAVSVGALTKGDCVATGDVLSGASASFDWFGEIAVGGGTAGFGRGGVWVSDVAFRSLPGVALAGNVFGFD